METNKFNSDLDDDVESLHDAKDETRDLTERVREGKTDIGHLCKDIVDITES